MIRMIPKRFAQDYALSQIRIRAAQIYYSLVGSSSVPIGSDLLQLGNHWLEPIDAAQQPPFPIPVIVITLFQIQKTHISDRVFSSL